MTPNISIAMCTYNGSMFIREQIESLIGQTYAPFEIIVCDDMSDDDTVNIIRSLSLTTNIPFRIVTNAERLGYRRNFMQAMSLCNGDLIAFCDQDDVWRSEKLALVGAAFADPAVLMVHHNARLVRADGEPFGRINEVDAFPPMAEPLSQSPWVYSLGFTQVFRQELAAAGYLREKFMGEQEKEWTAHDQWTFFLSSCLGKIAYIDIDLVDYRQHFNNTYGLVRSGSGGSLLNKMRYKIDGFSDYRINALVCKRRSEVLMEIVKLNIYNPTRQMLADGAYEFYISLYNAYINRCEIYSDAHIWSRMSAWIKFLFMGHYQKNGRFYFRLQSALRDLFHGVLRGALRTKSRPTTDYSIRINLTG